MNRKNGNYVVPPEIMALVPKNIPCKVEAQFYVPKKNNPLGNPQVRYYVYEDRSKKTGTSSQNNKPNGRILLGKIMGDQFIPNEKGAIRIEELRKISTETNDNKTEENPDYKKYIPRIRDIDPQIKNYGEYATVLATTENVLKKLQENFNDEDAIRIYVLGIIYFIEEYTSASYCADIFKQSVLSNKWQTLSFGENTINEFLKDIGRAGLQCELYSQSLISESSSLTAIDGHVIVSSSKQNELAEYGYKYHELGNKQINIMGVYDAENHRQLVSKAMQGSLPDKLSIKDLFVAYKFKSKTFLCDSGFYSDDNIGLLRNDDNHFVMPVPETMSIAKMIKKDMVFTEIFMYEHLNEDGTNTMRSILYKECSVHDLEVMDDERKEKEAAEKTAKAATEAKPEEKPKKYYTQFNKKSQWGDDRVILYRDKVMHDKLVYDYRMQIGRDKNHTDEDLAKKEPGFGVIVLRTNWSKDCATAEQVYLWYKKRWTIETHYNFIANIVKFDGLQTQDYYSMLGLSFLILIVGQIKAEYCKKLRSEKSSYANRMSIKESLVKAAFIKISLHQDMRWYISIMNTKSLELLTNMGVSLEKEMEKLNNNKY